MQLIQKNQLTKSNSQKALHPYHKIQIFQSTEHILHDFPSLFKLKKQFLTSMVLTTKVPTIYHRFIPYSPPKAIDEKLNKQKTTKSKNGHYTFYLFSGNQASNDVIMGKYRHGWVQLKSIENSQEISTAINKIIETSRIYFVPDVRDHRKASEQQRFTVQPSHEYRLSFSLLNADPSERTTTWEFKQMVEGNDRYH